MISLYTKRQTVRPELHKMFVMTIIIISSPSWQSIKGTISLTINRPHKFKASLRTTIHNLAMMNHIIDQLKPLLSHYQTTISLPSILMMVCRRGIPPSEPDNAAHSTACGRGTYSTATLGVARYAITHYFHDPLAPGVRHSKCRGRPAGRFVAAVCEEADLCVGADRGRPEAQQEPPHAFRTREDVVVRRIGQRRPWTIAKAFPLRGIPWGFVLGL